MDIINSGRQKGDDINNRKCQMVISNMKVKGERGILEWGGITILYKVVGDCLLSRLLTVQEHPYNPLQAMHSGAGPCLLEEALFSSYTGIMKLKKYTSDIFPLA